MEEKSRTILVCEDDQTIRTMYADQFKSDKFTVFEVATGDKVIPAMQEHKPDLVVLDMIMPLKMGYEVLEELRSGSYPDIEKTVVILLTNIDQQEVKDKVAGLGAAGYFVKSRITPKELSQNISSLLP